MIGAIRACPWSFATVSMDIESSGRNAATQGVHFGSCEAEEAVEDHGMKGRAELNELLAGLVE
jgi:hypothetical protein